MPQPEPAGEPADGVDEHLVSLLDPTGFEAEQYRALQHMVEQMHKAADLAVVAVSSPGRGDGKTTTAINLAGALAHAADARVLLVDADLRQPDVLNHLGLRDGVGGDLVDAIMDPTLALDTVVTRHPTFNLSVLAARRPASSPYELLKGARFGGVLGEARSQYNYIVVDTPPLVAIPDCRAIAKWVDGFLIVVAAHRTPRRLVEEALSIIDSSKLAGLIFNLDERSVSERYYVYGRSSNGSKMTWWGRVLKSGGRNRGGGRRSRCKVA